MKDELIKLYNLDKKLYTKSEWLELFRNEYILNFPDDRVFINFFKTTEDNFDKKIKYIIDMLTKGKSKIDIEELVDISSDLWD